MAKLPPTKRIIKEDFSADEQNLIEKLAFALNPFLESVTRALNKNLNFDNLNQSFKQASVTTDGGGLITTNLVFKNDLTTRVVGIQCIKAENQTDSTNLSGAPFFTFTEQDKLITVSHITGLAASKTYLLTFIIYGT